MPKKTFEQAMRQLETIVHELESGDMALEKAMSKFEEGIRLSKFCTQKLDETQEKINLLVADTNGRIIGKPFSPGNESEE